MIYDEEKNKNRKKKIENHPTKWPHEFLFKLSVGVYLHMAAYKCENNALVLLEMWFNDWWNIYISTYENFCIMNAWYMKS